MNLPREIALSLKPNELARLRCSQRCAETHECRGLEAILLLRLGLLGDEDGALSETHLTKMVYDQTGGLTSNSIPVLKLG